MNLIRRHAAPLPGYQARSVEDQFGRLVENMVEDMLAPFSAATPWHSEGVATPRLHVAETDKAYQVEAEMPGVRKADVKVAIDHQRLTIEGECSQDQQRSQENLVYSERSVRKFARTLTLPGEVDDKAAEARLEDGVLKLTLPKKAGGAATRLTVQ